MAPYDLREEYILKRAKKMGPRGGQGRYCFAPNGKIRVLLWPGQEGVAADNRTVYLDYYQVMPRYTLMEDLILIPDEFCEPPVHYAVAKGLARFRDDPTIFIDLFRASTSTIS
jgi:hypothetical protein